MICIIYEVLTCVPPARLTGPFNTYVCIPAVKASINARGAGDEEICRDVAQKRRGVGGPLMFVLPPRSV